MIGRRSDREAPDAELVARVLGGERDAYAFLIRRYQERLYRHAFGMVQDSDAAADLVQDSFVKAYGSLPTCADPERFGGWVFRILRNRCSDHLREHRRRDIPLQTDAPYTDDTENPLRDTERRELRHAIEEALALLPDAQREAFLLKHVDGRSYEEMSEILDVGVSALKMRVARAREALRASLQAMGAASEASM
jgi:RNA polymerase sigma-70 factor, ECF subfamily